MHAFILAHECVTHWFRAKGNAAGRVEGATICSATGRERCRSAMFAQCAERQKAPEGKDSLRGQDAVAEGCQLLVRGEPMVWIGHPA